jgi:3-methyladenine DNA glycosylase AlkD
MQSCQQFTIDDITELLKNYSSVKYRNNIIRLGITPINHIGVRIPIIRKIAKKLEKNQKFANQLWNSNIHELKLLAVLVSEPDKFCQKNLWNWFDTLYSWDLCDHLCNNLLYQISECYENINQYCLDSREFVRRTSFSLLVSALSHQIDVDQWLDQYFRLAELYSKDSRIYIKKSISWALREIGKRRLDKRVDVISLSIKFKESENATQRWIGKSVYKEIFPLTG